MTIGIESPLKEVHIIVDKALELILKSKDILSLKKRTLLENWTAGFDEVSDCKDRINALKLEKSTILGGTSQSGRRRQYSSRVVNENDLQIIKNKNC